MKAQRYRIIIFCFITLGALIYFPRELYAQKGNKAPSKGKLERQTKKASKKNKKESKKEVDVSDELRRLHVSNQNKEVKKRMKKNKKRAKRYNQGKREFFLWRWSRTVATFFQTTFRKKN